MALSEYTDLTSLKEFLNASSGTKTYKDKVNGVLVKEGNYANNAAISIDDYLKNMVIDNNDQNTMSRMVTSSITGIEGIPYQFSSTVDRRLVKTTGMTGDESGVGRKFAEKIYSRFPLLFVTPCTAKFMTGFSQSDKTTVVESLITGVSDDLQQLLTGSGQYYSVQFAYAEYYQYLNCMMNILAYYLGIGDVQVSIGGKQTKLGTADWSKEASSDFKTFFSAKENLVFYVDGFNQVSQSFSNDTTDSSLASQINGMADQINEIKFLFGDANEGAIAAAAGGASSITSSIASSLSGAAGSLGGGIVQSLAENGVNTILNGGKIIFPEIWSNSSSDLGCGSFEFKYRSPDHDTLSIYLNVLKPYCKWLALAMCHESKDSNNKWDPHSYTSPFLVKAYLKGKFECDMGIISSLSVTKGAECMWNDDGLPTQIDISVDIKNLYKNLAMVTYDMGNMSIVNNTAYMDFVANMAGLNIGQMQMARKAEYYWYITKSKVAQWPAHIGLKGSQALSRLYGALYNKTS